MKCYVKLLRGDIMNDSKSIVKIVDVLQSTMADDKDKGDIIFNKVKKLIEDREKNIKIDFTNTDGLNTAFLNNAIGRIFSIKYDQRKESKITLINFPLELKDLLEEAINTARDKYSI